MCSTFSSLRLLSRLACLSVVGGAGSQGKKIVKQNLTLCHNGDELSSDDNLTNSSSNVFTRKSNPVRRPTDVAFDCRDDECRRQI